MIVGALLQATAYTVAHMIVARIVAGVGMGFINSTVPVLMAEFAPKATRGIYVCAQLSTLNFGIMLVYWIDYAFGKVEGGPSYAWRVPVILQCIFLIPMLFIIMIIPETPRWLISHHRAEEALNVLRRLNKKSMSDAAIESMHADICNTVAYEASIGAGTWSDLLKSDEIQSRRRFLIACGVQIFQQLGGINALIYYSNTLFQKSLGFDSELSALMSGFLNTWFFVASFIPWFLIDRVGRRPLFLSMISLMAAVMVVQTGLIWNVEKKTAIATACGAGAAAMLFIFQGAFTIGFQATVWVYPSEILPLKLRQRGSSISTASNWICVSDALGGSASTQLMGIELLDRVHYPSSDSQYRIPNLHHLRGKSCPSCRACRALLIATAGFERSLGADNLLLLPRDQGHGFGRC